MVNVLELSGFRPCKDGFFGRKQDLEDLKNRAETKGLTFIVGPPRRGKTRLMFELARYLNENNQFLYSYYELEAASANPFHYCVERLFENYIKNAPNNIKAKQFAKSHFEKVKKVTGVVLKVLGSTDPTGAGSLAQISAGLMLSGNPNQGLTLHRLPYEIIRETVNEIFKKSSKKTVLLLDQWKMGENNEENKNILKSFLSDQYNWPQVHIFVNLRPDNKAHEHCKELMLEYSNIVQIFQPAPIALNEPEEKNQLLNLLNNEVPLARQLNEASLLQAIGVTPMVIERILDKKFEDMEGLEETIKGAVEGTYIDIIKKIRKLDDNLRRILIFLSLLPELNTESWEKLKILGEDFSCTPDYLDQLRQQGSSAMSTHPR
jgi:AAA+ ATPase superfamily predicted ATPase